MNRTPEEIREMLDAADQGIAVSRRMLERSSGFGNAPSTLPVTPSLPPSEKIKWKTVAEWIEEYGNAAPPVPTGTRSMDQLLRGGMRPGKVCVIGGEPGAGKTAFATQVSAHMASSGALVAYLSVDEGPFPVAVRLAQHSGVDREAAETGRPDAIRAAVEAVGKMSVLIPDPNEVLGLLAFFDRAAEVALERDGAQLVVVVDSLQRMLPSTDRARHEQLDQIMTEIRKATLQTNAVTFCTSEIARGAYTGSKMKTPDLAAFKGGGGIEYGGDVAMVMRRQGDSQFFRARVVKNRTGSRLGEFYLMLDDRTCLFSEVTHEEFKMGKGDQFDIATL